MKLCGGLTPLSRGMDHRASPALIDGRDKIGAYWRAASVKDENDSRISEYRFHEQMRASRPRILYLSYGWPHEGSSGYRLRTLQVARALKNVGEVHLLVASENNGPETIEKTASEFQVHDYISIRGFPREEKSMAQRFNSLSDPFSTSFPTT